MTNAQKWTAIVLSFMVAIVFIAGICSCVWVKAVENILVSPAGSSEFEINGEFLIQGKDIDGVPVSLRVDNIQGKVNSKILDLILIAINNDDY